MKVAPLGTRLAIYLPILKVTIAIIATIVIIIAIVCSSTTWDDWCVAGLQSASLSHLRQVFVLMWKKSSLALLPKSRQRSWSINLNLQELALLALYWVINIDQKGNCNSSMLFSKSLQPVSKMVAHLQVVAATCIAFVLTCVTKSGSTILPLRWLAVISVLASSVLYWVILTAIAIHIKTEPVKGTITYVLVDSIAGIPCLRSAIDIGTFLLFACCYVVAFGQQSRAPLRYDCSFSGPEEIYWGLYDLVMSLTIVQWLPIMCMRVSGSEADDHETNADKPSCWCIWCIAQEAACKFRFEFFHAEVYNVASVESVLGFASVTAIWHGCILWVSCNSWSAVQGTALQWLLSGCIRGALLMTDQHEAGYRK